MIRPDYPIAYTRAGDRDTLVGRKRTQAWTKDVIVPGTEQDINL